MSEITQSMIASVTGLAGVRLLELLAAFACQTALPAYAPDLL